MTTINTTTTTATTTAAATTTVVYGRGMELLNEAFSNRNTPGLGTNY